MGDSVNHPSHYISSNGIETIKVIEAFTSDLEGVEAFDTGNILKYICRWKHKNGLEDLKKASWYLNHLIEHVTKAEEEYAYADVIMPSRNDIVGIIDQMKDTIGGSGFVTVADLYAMVGRGSVSWTDNEYGWTNLDSAEAIKVRGGFRLKLPDVKHFNNEKENETNE